MLRRVEVAAMLHGIEQNLAEGGGYFLGFDIGKIGSFAEELNEAVGREVIP